jgi:Copper binding periplasmic protein CusF
MSRSSRPDPVAPLGRAGTIRIAALLLLVAGASLIALLCLVWMGGPGQMAATSAPPEYAYTVRGRIVSLPAPTQPGSGLNIQHEAIPDWVNPQGEKIGMGTMIMPFTPAPGTNISALSPGDLVQFRLEVRWNPPRFARILQIDKLPPDTRLELGERP